MSQSLQTVVQFQNMVFVTTASLGDWKQTFLVHSFPSKNVDLMQGSDKPRKSGKTLKSCHF